MTGAPPPTARFPLGSFGCIGAIIAGAMAVLFALLAWLSGPQVARIVAALAWTFAAASLGGMIVFIVDGVRHPLSKLGPLEAASGSPYDTSAKQFDGTVWIVWYEDQFSHDPSFATAFCFSEAQAYAAIKLAGGKMLEPGWDGYTIDSSTPEQIRWIFGVSKPEVVAELERRIRSRDYRAVAVPI